MVHAAWGFAWGTPEEIEECARDLKDTQKRVNKIYAERTGKTESDIAEIIKKDTWMSAEQAVADKWCDEVIKIEDPTKSDPPKASAPTDPPSSSPSVLRRMMEAVGFTFKSTAENLEEDCKMLIEEVTALRAENDKFRGMDAMHLQSSLPSQW